MMSFVSIRLSSPRSFREPPLTHGHPRGTFPVSFERRGCYHPRTRRGEPSLRLHRVGRHADEHGFGVRCSLRPAAIECVRDAVLVGTVGPDRARSVIVGLRQGPRGFVARKIGQTEDYDVQQGWTDHVIAVDSLTPAGRQPPAGQRVRKVLWVRYQELDCKGDGLILRVVAGAWVTKPSTCTYGE